MELELGWLWSYDHLLSPSREEQSPPDLSARELLRVVFGLHLSSERLFIWWPLGTGLNFSEDLPQFLLGAVLFLLT